MGITPRPTTYVFSSSEREGAVVNDGLDQRRQVGSRVDARGSTHPREVLIRMPPESRGGSTPSPPLTPPSSPSSVEDDSPPHHKSPSAIGTPSHRQQSRKRPRSWSTKRGSPNIPPRDYAAKEGLSEETSSGSKASSIGCGCNGRSSRSSGALDGGLIMGDEGGNLTETVSSYIGDGISSAATARRHGSTDVMLVRSKDGTGGLPIQRDGSASEPLSDDGQSDIGSTPPESKGGEDERDTVADDGSPITSRDWVGKGERKSRQRLVFSGEEGDVGGSDVDGRRAGREEAMGQGNPRDKGEEDGITLDLRRSRQQRAVRVVVHEVLSEDFGLFTWPSGVVLACLIWARRQEFAGVSVVEIGAGTALPGLLAAKLGASVVLTDREGAPWVLDNMRGAVAANGLPIDNTAAPPVDVAGGSGVSDGDDGGDDGDAGASPDTCAGAGASAGADDAKSPDDDDAKSPDDDGAKSPDDDGGSGARDSGVAPSVRASAHSRVWAGPTEGSCGTQGQGKSRDKDEKEEEKEKGEDRASKEVERGLRLGAPRSRLQSEKRAQEEDGAGELSVDEPATPVGKCSVQGLSWGSVGPAALRLAREQCAQVVLGADVFYSSEHFDSVLATVFLLLSASSPATPPAKGDGGDGSGDGDRCLDAGIEATHDSVVDSGVARTVPCSSNLAHGTEAAADLGSPISKTSKRVFLTAYQERSARRSLRPLLHKWGMEARVIHGAPQRVVPPDLWETGRYDSVALLEITLKDEI
ncbi:unnamed protein product [Scytosiphon promiscuus]